MPIPRPRNLFEIHADERFRETYRTLWASLEEEVKKGAALWQPQKLNPRAFVLPPGAANVEDDVKAWEAQERRAKWKLMIVRVAARDRATCRCGSTGPTAGSTRCGSRARCASLVIS